MKKDIYNGKVREQYIGYMNASLIFATVLFLAFAVMCLCMALFYKNMDDSARIGMYVFSAIGFVLAVFLPIITILCIRSYPKHKTLTHLLVKQYLLKSYIDADVEQPEESKEQPKVDDEQ